MTHQPLLHGYIAMLIKRDPMGHPSSIEFFNSATGFGTLDAATVYREPKAMAFGAIEWIHSGFIALALLREMKNRAELTVVAGFDHLSQDAIGDPEVFAFDLQCPECGAIWHETRVEPPSGFPCPKCHWLVEPTPANTSWIGPVSDQLQALWRALPSAEVVPISVGARLKVYATKSGCIITDAFGHRLVISETSRGVHVEIAALGAANFSTFDVATGGLPAGGESGAS